MKPFATLVFLTLTATAASAAPPTDAELEACIGSKGAAPAVFDGKIKRGMKPADVAAVYPGADKLDKFKFASVKAKDCAGAKTFEFHYQEDRKTKEVLLYNVRIEFDKALTKDEDFYKRLTAVLVAKYGAVKDEDIKKKLLTWGTKQGIAQLAVLTPSHPWKLSAPLDK